MKEDVCNINTHTFQSLTHNVGLDSGSRLAFTLPSVPSPQGRGRVWCGLLSDPARNDTNLRLERRVWVFGLRFNFKPQTPNFEPALHFFISSLSLPRRSPKDEDGSPSGKFPRVLASISSSKLLATDFWVLIQTYCLIDSLLFMTEDAVSNSKLVI